MEAPAFASGLRTVSTETGSLSLSPSSSDLKESRISAVSAAIEA
jgi:hypothetical protein